MKRQREEEITIEIDGQVFHGRRVVEGARKLYQTVWYGGHLKHDGHPYRLGEVATMQSIARTILRELVQEFGHIYGKETGA